MSRGVVRHRRETDGPGHDRSNPVPFRKPITLEEERLIILEPVCLPQLGADTRAIGALDPPRVRDLAAPRRIERRLAQLREEEPVAGFLERTDLREDVDLFVTDELGAKAGALRKLGSALVVLRDRPTRA